MTGFEASLTLSDPFLTILTTPGTCGDLAATLLQKHPVNYPVNNQFQNSNLYILSSFETL